MRLLLVGLVILIILGPALARGESLTLTTDEIFPRSTPEGTGFLDLLLKDAFSLVQVEIRIVHLPSERALINANAGLDDGCFDRIAGLEERYPNLVMVPERICTYPFTAFVRDPGLKISDWASLAPYNVGMVNGWQIVEQHLPRVKSVNRVRDDTALFELLDKNRVDVVIHERLAGRMLVKNLGLSGIVALEPPLAEPDMFLYLHKRHADLVPRLAAALKQLNEDGTRQALVDGVLGASGLP